MAPSRSTANQKKLRLFCILAASLAGLSNCSLAQREPEMRQTASPPAGSPSLNGLNAQGDNAQNDNEVIAAQSNRLIKVEVTVTAPVKKMLPEDDVGLPHEKFLILLSNGSTVLIAHDIKYAPVVPVHPGDMVRIHGEYIWNAKGGLIHWTHRSDTPRHEGGWIEFGGQRYE
jgi:Protein of unknown function (DUF3465)